ADAMAPVRAAATGVSGLDVGGGGTVLDVAAAALPSGYAVGFVLAPQSAFYGVALDASLTANRSMPAVTSPLSYTAATLDWDGTHLLAQLTAAGGGVWLKTIPIDMSPYLTATQEAGAGAKPGFAAASSTWFGIVHDAGNVGGYVLAADGTPTG